MAAWLAVAVAVATATTAAAVVAAAAANADCGCFLAEADTAVVCAGYASPASLCYEDAGTATSDAANKATKLSISGVGAKSNAQNVSGHVFRLDAGLIRDRLGVNVFRLEELTVRNTSIARVLVCAPSKEKAGEPLDLNRKSL